MKDYAAYYHRIGKNLFTCSDKVTMAQCLDALERSKIRREGISVKLEKRGEFFIVIGYTNLP